MTELTVKRGDTWSWTCTFADADGAPVDLAGVTARCQVRDKRDKLLADYSAQLTLGASDLALRVLENQLPVGVHYFDIELTFPDGSILSTETKAITVIKDITLEAGA